MMLRLRPLCPRLWRPCSVRLPRMVSGCLPKEGHAVAGPLASPVTSVGRGGWHRRLLGRSQWSAGCPRLAARLSGRLWC
jgi:hypothetical protein